MEFKVDKSICAGCGACIQVCPNDAIKIGINGKAIINQKKCKKCGKCQEACPLNAIKKIENSKEKIL